MNNATDRQADYLKRMIGERRVGATVHIECDPIDEIITAWIDGVPFIFEIGSDDDDYVFVYGDDVIVVPLED
jgi:hypothetical protein